MSMTKIKMEEQDNLRLKRAQYEKDSIADLIARNMNEVPSQFWIDKLVDATISLEDCKQEMSKKYIFPQFTPDELKRVNWKANFTEGEFEVYFDE